MRRPSWPQAPPRTLRPFRSGAPRRRTPSARRHGPGMARSRSGRSHCRRAARRSRCGRTCRGRRECPRQCRRGRARRDRAAAATEPGGCRRAGPSGAFPAPRGHRCPLPLISLVAASSSRSTDSNDRAVCSARSAVRLAKFRSASRSTRMRSERRIHSDETTLMPTRTTPNAKSARRSVIQDGSGRARVLGMAGLARRRTSRRARRPHRAFRCARTASRGRAPHRVRPLPRP